MAILQQLSEAMADVSDRVLRSLVQIRNGQRGIGAGTIWHADGLILTNAHVVDSGMSARQTLTVRLQDGREFLATLLARDPTFDLAALRIHASQLPAIELGDSHHLQAGAFVFAYGFPWGVEGGATSGVVIRTGALFPETTSSQQEWIAASLHLRPGHSGGPMVDTQGRLVGINTLMNGPEVGMAIPVHVAKAFLKETDAQQMKAPIIY